MIIVELFAGLGNQLFQYSAGFALSQKLNVPLKLNIQNFNKSDIYKFDLEPFNISATIATDQEISRAVDFPSDIISKSILKISEKLKPKILKRSIIREKTFHYDNVFNQATKNCYLFGHWQSEKYFNENSDLLKYEFSLKDDYKDLRHDLLNKICATISISLIIRRGDYLKYPELNLYGEDLTYYYNAMDYINSKIESPHYFIFSDDIDWVKLNLKLNKPHTFVSETYPGEEYKINTQRHQDLILISYCKHHIITNSTFAWWGAWLSKYSNKIVIAPKNWFAKSKIWYDGNIANTDDIIPKSWITL